MEDGGVIVLLTSQAGRVTVHVKPIYKFTYF